MNAVLRQKRHVRRRTKLCFVISPIGEETSKVRLRSNLLLKHIIVPAARKCGYRTIRADSITRPGIITSQIFRHLVKDPLVVADLSGQNPNVFYELAIRHAVRKPVVLLIKKEERIPFDVAQSRVIEVDHRDLKSVARARKDLVSHIRSARRGPEENPLSIAIDLEFLKQIRNPIEKSSLQIASMLSDFRSRNELDVNRSRSPTDLGVSTGFTSLLTERELAILEYLTEAPARSVAEVATKLQCDEETVYSHLELMKDRGIYNGTMALLQYGRLDLSYVPVVIQSPLENLHDIWLVCHAHPYCEYFAKIFGANRGAYLTFTIPSKASHLLMGFLDGLVRRGICQDYRVYDADEVAREFPRGHLRLFDLRTGQWNYDERRWQLQDGENVVFAQKHKQETETRPGLNLITKRDIKLLSELSDDARVPVHELARRANLPVHAVRERIRFLESNGFIIGYRAMVVFSKLNLSGNMLFICTAGSSEVEVCRKMVLRLPFPGTFIPIREGFSLQISVPSQMVSFVHAFLSRNCKRVEASWFDLATSDVGMLNAEAYTSEGWRADRTFMMDDPLRLYDHWQRTS